MSKSILPVDQEAKDSRLRSRSVSRRNAIVSELNDNKDLTAKTIPLFASCLEQRYKYGHIVKNIEFYPVVSPCPQNYHQLPDDVDKHIDTILQHVPNIERIYSPWSAFETDHILKCLEVTNHQLKHLKSLPFSKEMTLQQRNVYADLALKVKDSLTELSLIPHSENPDFILLKANMKNFKSLEQLQLCGSSVEGSIIAEVDDLVNECHEKIRVLELDQCNLSSNIEQVNPNSSIKTLRLSDSTMLSASAIQYFATKLTSLKKLVVTATSARPSQIKEETFDWWNKMTALCQRVDSYNISMHIPVGADDLKEQIFRWADVFKTNEEKSTIEIDRDFEKSSTKENSYIVRMKQGNSCVCLFYSIGDAIFREIAMLDKILQQYLPNVIEILNVEQMLRSEILFEDFGPELNPHDYLGASNNSKSWEVFHVVALLTKNNPESVVHLDRMILSEPESAEDHVSEQVSSIISELKFTNSLINSNAFPRMSLKLLKIDTLILDGCFFVSSSPQRLEIHLPDTELGHLELNLSRMLRLGYVSCRTVVVKKASTETATYQYIKDEDFKTDQKITDTIGSKDNFLIYIVCKELQSWVVTGMNKPEEEWKQQKVQAAPIIKRIM